ncbi:citron Rho-interacting kinase-like isoform X6 [Physella acuta]|uniref:citron Rho-interacting kinase-like isoform X6 n=1 Tax=Physella acuta TaxID=109671 RepID=UPI0027DB34CF|nr:citron Rho-interacting kinase-like isoform X6 [Physella acuta]
MSFHRNHTKNQDAANMHEVKEMLTKECLLDGFLALYEECTHDNLLKIKSVSSFIHKFKNTVYQSKKHRMKASDFEVKAVIGRGHFGEVRVVREKATDAIYAMKVLRKTDLLAQPEISCYEEERDIMGNSASPWITELHFAFQDSCNLYLVMDFHAGGDLLSLLSRHDDIFEEDMAKFYLAETAIAINSLHEMGYLHRDIKPENILLDCTGHVKLADFGSAAKLNSEKKVTAHMPVGTPDYVAPELLNSMSKARQRLTYGPEVDWWSLGVCAYEMLFGATPFSNEHGSMVSTYANIMDFKNSLRFPTESDVSEDGKDLVKKLLTDSHSRLTWTEIKAHPFFKGVNWDTIREGEAVYVPSIHGLDDTSHFDEVETVKRQPDIEAFIQPKDFSGRDLPFVGFTFSKDSPQDSNNSHAVSEQTSISSSNTRLLQKLEEKNQELEKLRAILHKQHISPNDLETRAVSLMENLSAMNDEIRVLEDELLEVRLEEMQAEIIMLESGHEKLKAQLREKESQLLKTQTSLQDVNNQLQSQQFKLERERRKSREGQHKDLVLLELRNETWESLLADKQASIDELTAKLHELEELVEAYEDSQEKQATQVQELQQKMNTSLHDLSTYTVSDVNLSGDSTQAKVELDNLHHALCPSKKKLTLHVTLKSGRCSFLDNKTLNKLQMLQKMVDKYADKAKEWRDKEEELILKISSLESDNNILKQKEGMGRKMKDSLMEKVSSYQQEVETQKSIIKDLQGTMRSYLNKSLSVTETESKLKETQQSKLNLESELMSLKEEAERSRHSALQKARQMEDAIHKLEEQRALAQDYKKRYDCQVEVTEAKVASLEDELTKVTCDRQRLERRETTLAAQEKVFEDLKVKGLEQQLVVMRSDLTEKEKLIEELRANLDLQTANVADLRNEIEDMMTSENDLVAQLEKEALSNKTLTEENEKLSAKVKECDVSDPRNVSVEKLQLEIRELTSERDELKARLGCGEQDEKGHLLTQVKSLQQQLDESKREMEIRKGANEFSAGDIPAYLRHELEESNLALSEARSLLAASKRQELELKDRIDRLQRILDNKAVENGRYLQNAQDAMAELKTLKSQFDTLQRQYKVLEGKYSALQKERGSNTGETVRLMEEVQNKQQQYQMEYKKAEQLAKVCTELEDQIKDMEVIIQEFKEREIQWDNIKLTYEQAVNAREHELVTQQVQAARSETEGQVKQQIESVRALHRADLEKLHHNLREERAQVCKLSHKLEESEQKEKSALQLFESQMKEMEKSNQEKMTLKEELTQALSENCSLRKENLKLRKHLDEAMDKFEMIIGEKVSLENFTEALQALHFLDKYKFESTIGQQMKLIDYLQELHLEHSGKKKKSKFFGSKSGSKEALNKQASLPLSDLQTTQSLLQDQVDQLRQENAQQANENGWFHQIKKVLKLKQRGQVEANVEVRLTRSALNALTNPGATHSAEVAGRNSSTSLASASSSSSRSSPHHTPRSQRGYLFDGTRQADHIPQRMHHNIPHRFATGLNTRAAKCGLCLGTVHFVRQASKCQECGMVVHPKCSSSVPSTCGLPTEYVRHFELMMRQIYRDETGRETDIDRSAVKMEGWLKVPRVGKSGWENRYCILEGTWLSLYLDEQDSNPVDSFDLNPIDADVSVHCAVTSAELSNTASTDLHYVLRLDQDPLTTCWPGRYLYLMTTNFQEKQRWVASLEAIVKSAQCKSDLYRNRSQTLIVMSLKEEERREFNCTLVISAQLVLVGTDDGLYAFNPQALTSKRKHMTQLTGFGSVHQMALAKGVDLILLLTGPERRLVMLENKLVKCRMSQTLGGETTPFSFKTVEGLQCCTIFDVALWNNASYLCVGTPSKLYLMKYNPSLAMYCVRKEFPSSEPCSCVCLADNYAIVGTERFYKINIEHPSLLDFVDRQDNSLAFAAYGAANHNSFPLSVVRVSPESLPLEFLLCFHEFGVFVDHRGQRSRATDIKWSGLPLAFAYVEPFLYVTYTNTIQATVVPTDKSQAKGRQTVIDVQSPRYLGPAPGAGCVYISSTTTNITEIICLRGQEDLTADSDKENCLMASSEKQVHFVSPRKPQRFQQLAKEGSLSSLTSNSSSSTFASVESGV